MVEDDDKFENDKETLRQSRLLAEVGSEELYAALHTPKSQSYSLHHG